MGIFSPQIPSKTLVPVCRQLATAYDAGIPIVQTFDLIVRQTKDRKVRDVMTRMRDTVRQGNTLGEAARSESKYLPNVFVELVTTGEHGGKLDVMFRDLAQYYEDRLAMKRRIKSMLVLPSLQLIAAWFLGTFALRLLGKIKLFLGNMDAPGAGIDLNSFFNEYLAFQGMTLMAAALVFAVTVILARAGVIGHVTGMFTTFMWPVSRVTRKFAMARFFRSMSLLISSGLRIDHCIIRSASVAANPYIEKDLLQAVPRVRDGATLVEAFLPCKYVSDTGREMIMVGEQSGQLEQALRKASDWNMEEASHAVDVATRIMGVVIVLTVCLLIGYIVITFWTTYFGGMMDALGV